MKTSFLVSLILAPLLVLADLNLEDSVIREDAPDEETTLEPYGQDDRRLGGYYYYDDDRVVNRNRPLPDIEFWVFNRGSFSTLTALLAGSGLAPGGPLSGPPDYTLFSPSNMAFRDTFRAYPGLRRYLLSPDGASALTQILTYHALAGSYYERDIPIRGITLRTLSGEELTAFKECSMGENARECTVYLLDGTNNEALVTHADNYASNGVVHAVDKVLIPPSLVPLLERFRRN